MRDEDNHRKGLCVCQSALCNSEASLKSVSGFSLVSCDNPGENGKRSRQGKVQGLGKNLQGKWEVFGTAVFAVSLLQHLQQMLQKQKQKI